PGIATGVHQDERDQHNRGQEVEEDEGRAADAAGEREQREHRRQRSGRAQERPTSRIAFTSWVPRRSFVRKAETPAWRARSTSAEMLEPVRIRTDASGCCSRICRAASIPSRTGIEMSIKVTSGTSAFARSIA